MSPDIIHTASDISTQRQEEHIGLLVTFLYRKKSARPCASAATSTRTNEPACARAGLSGGGKTTLVKLISRFYDIQQGVITIDGVDTRLYPLDVLCNNVSMVLQDSVLFEGTIRENIAIGRPGASIEQIVDVAQKATIHETIMNLPEGYDTIVREQGKNFSGGQRQRIAIARALLRDAPILILDEPTAALDVEAEIEVMRALDQLIIGRTVIVISHRLSTLGNVDEVLVLKQGQIAERGSYKQLKQMGASSPISSASRIATVLKKSAISRSWVQLSRKRWLYREGASALLRKRRRG